MDEPRSVTLNSTMAVCGMIAAGMFAAKTAFVAPGWVWLAGLLWLALAVTAALAQTGPVGRAYLTGTLRTRHYTQVYRFVARRLNDWVWRRVGRMHTRLDGTVAPPPETTAAWPLLRAALTWRLLDRALQIAVAYPIVALMLPWLLGGDAVLGAGVVVFPAAGFWLEQAVVPGIFVVLALGFLGVRLASGSPQIPWRSIARGLPLVVVAVAITTALVSLDAGAFVFAFVVASAYAFSFVFAAAVAGAGAIVFAFVVSGAIAFAFEFTVISTVGGTFATAIAITFCLAINRLWSLGRQGWALGLLAAIWALGLLAVVLLVDITGLRTDQKSILVFLAVLPLVNGIFDALSYALTLALSRKGLATRWAPLWGLLDLALGAVLFFALGATMVAVIAALNALGTAPIYDLAALFAGLRASPGEYWWLYLILFSTLAPTALHILVAALAVQGWFVFQRPRRTVANWIAAAPTSHPAAVGGCLAQALIWWLPLMALALAGWALWLVIGTWAAAAGLLYLDTLEALARRIAEI